jgi:NAD(P)H-dependent FMN reductase
MTGPARFTVLGLCGSLRAASLNQRMLRAASRVAPPHVVLEIYPSLGRLPLFNPDLEPADPPPVADLRQRIIAADALAIASPEYAHGVSGVIKNALDWMVGNESFVLKRVAVFNASPRALHARAALEETLRTMSAVVVDAACAELPLLGSGLDEDAIVSHPQLAPVLRAALELLVPVRGDATG